MELNLQKYFSREFFELYKKKLYISGVVLLFVVFVYIFIFAAPFNPKQKTISISSGQTLVQISKTLKDEDVVRSAILFRLFAVILRGEGGVKAGVYFFGGNDNVFQVAWHMVEGDYGIATERITLTEGADSLELSRLFDPNVFKNVDNKELYSLAHKREGYLFPDTYFVPVTASTSDVIDLLSNNFDRKIATINLASSTTSKKLNEILTMASIIEGEAKKDVDRKIVSGILWKRIKIGMALQVDATFSYINGKGSDELTLSDLKINSPYNTYINRGLPPTPINNPGLEAIRAAMFPTQTDYLYYLSDKDSVMHYAKTFEEHKENKEKYLR